MSSVAPMIAYRRYRAPQKHGEEFSDPPLSLAGALLRENIDRRTQGSVEWCGDYSSELMQDARAEFVQLARQYTRQYRDVDIHPAVDDRLSSVILCGHQPELFHPGVWFKNFVLGCLGQSLNSVAINLIADNDVISSASIRVPAGSSAAPGLESVAYDAPSDEMPFELRPILDEQLFASFGERVKERLRPFSIRPLVGRWWPTAVSASRRVRNLGYCLAEARHVLEGEWGNQTLEVPLGRVCETDTFRRFAVHLLDKLLKLNADYNGSLLDYRGANRIRSRTHPVSELVRQDEWYEAPFWIWSLEAPQRKRLFGRRRMGEIELTDRGSIRFAIPSAEQGKSALAVEKLAEMANRGVKLRPRALLTTMFARMMLGDLFLHGIGGGKYDQLTDSIIQRFFGVEPPRFIVLTATAHLPVEKPEANAADLQKIDSILRDLVYNPDRYVDVNDESRPWIAEKQKWLNADASTASPRERHLGLVNSNRMLQSFVAELRSQLISERDRVAKLVEHNKLLGSREFSFCLFPEETLRALLLDKC